MKRVSYLLLMSIFAFISCDNNDLYTGDNNDAETLSKYVMTESYSVPVQEEHTTTVKFNGEVLYEGNMAIEIQVPKSFVNTRTLTGIETDHEWDKGSGSGNGANWFNAYKKGILMFEDVKVGDNDYNDFICHIDETIEYKTNKGEGSNLKLEKLVMTPIAMGNSLPLQFGMEIVIDGKVWKDLNLSTDVRKDFYSSKAGFINTDKNSDYTEGTIVSLKNENSANGANITKSFATNYYIVVGGRKHYACDSSKAALTDNGTPFGLFAPQIEIDEFVYPWERTEIFEAFPNFQKWVDGASVNPFSNPIDDCLYKKK